MFQPQIQYYCVKQLWALQQGLFTKQTLHEVSGSRDSSVVEHRTCHGKVVGSSPSRSSRRIFFSRVNFLCWFSFWYLFHPLVTTVAYKRSKSFCQKCKWQVTTKHTWTLHMWLWMKWHCKLVQNCMVYRECLLRWQQFHMSTSHVTTKQRCEYTALMAIQKFTIKSNSHSLIITHDKSPGSLLESSE